VELHDIIAFVDCVSCLQYGSDRETCFTVALQFAIMHAYVTASSVGLAVRLPLNVPPNAAPHTPHASNKQQAVLQWYGFYTILKISVWLYIGVDMIQN